MTLAFLYKLTEKRIFFLSWFTARWSGIGSVCLMIETLSPVNNDWSTRSVVESMAVIRISAGALSPTATSTISPGTSSRALIRWTCPGRFCRITLQLQAHILSMLRWHFQHYVPTIENESLMWSNTIVEWKGSMITYLPHTNSCIGNEGMSRITNGSTKAVRRFSSSLCSSNKLRPSWIWNKLWMKKKNRIIQEKNAYEWNACSSKENFD